MTGGGVAFLPYGRHSIDEADIAAVAAVLRSDTLTGGPEVARFEAALAEYVGARFAVACANGTAALHLAAMALDLGPSVSAVVPSMTFLATANGPFYTGCEIAFADVDPGTGLMSVASALDASRCACGPVKAMFPVHLNGQCVDMEGLQQLAASQGSAIVEDACHAIGAAYRTSTGETVKVGSCRHSAMTVFSLHPVKTIAMGEGGVVTTNDPELFQRLQRLRNHGMVREPADFSQSAEAFCDNGGVNPWYYEMPAPGYNYRASDINCALGRSQLGKIDIFLARRRELADLYTSRLAPLKPVICPVPRVPGCESGCHLYVVKINFARLGISRAQVMLRLRDAGIGTQVHYLPVHRQPFWRNRISHLRLPGADAYYDTCLSLPLFPAMDDKDVGRVVAELKNLLEDENK